MNAGRNVTTLPRPTRCHIHTVLGDFNKGKTWLLGKLTEAEFPAGHTVHTPGLCARSLRVRQKELIVLDTPGRNSP
eukprot:gene45862-45588_t